MLKLFIFNFVLIAIAIIGALVLKAKIKDEKKQNVCLLIVSISTILCHNSSLLYHFFKDGSQFSYLKSNPNLILPIYPCNLVMWCCFIYALIKDKDSKFGHVLADFIFWIGSLCCLGGLFANIDFINNPTLLNYDITKGILAHAIMLFNVILVFAFNRISFDFLRNIKSTVISVLFMFIDGLYINLLYSVIVSKEAAYDINSMFIIHSPFSELEFIIFPTISIIAILFFVVIFSIIDFIKYKKGNRWYNRIRFKH